MPHEPVREELAPLISELARRFDTPSFAPHVTLVGSIEGSKWEVVAKCTLLTSEVHRVRIETAELGYDEEFFRALYLRVASSSSLMAARSRAVEVFALHPAEEYDPHLSLLYGNLSLSTKVSIARELGARSPLGFEAAALHLFDTAGPVPEWHQVGAFPIQ